MLLDLRDLRDPRLRSPGWCSGIQKHWNIRIFWSILVFQCFSWNSDRTIGISHNFTEFWPEWIKSDRIWIFVWNLIEYKIYAKIWSNISVTVVMRGSWPQKWMLVLPAEAHRMTRCLTAMLTMAGAGFPPQARASTHWAPPRTPSI